MSKRNKEEETIERVDTPESSTVAWASYDPASTTFQIAFRRRGKDTLAVYETSQMPLGVWEAFKGAVSKGGFYNLQIKPVFMLRPVL